MTQDVPYAIFLYFRIPEPIRIGSVPTYVRVASSKVTSARAADGGIDIHAPRDIRFSGRVFSFEIASTVGDRRRRQAAVGSQ